MKINTRFILVLLCILFALNACKAVRHTSVDNNVSAKTDQFQTVKKVENKQTNIQQTDEKKFEEIEKVTQDWTAKLINYDTKQPIDKISGKPPVQSQLEITNHVKSEKVKESTDKLKTDLSSHYTTQIDSLSKENSQLKQQLKQCERSVSNWWKWLLAGMGIPFFLIIVWKFVPKFW